MLDIAIDFHQSVDGGMDPLVNRWSVKAIVLEDIAQILVDGDWVLLGTRGLPNEVGKVGLEGCGVERAPVREMGVLDCGLGHEEEGGCIAVEPVRYLEKESSEYTPQKREHVALTAKWAARGYVRAGSRRMTMSMAAEMSRDL